MKDHNDPIINIQYDASLKEFENFEAEHLLGELKLLTMLQMLYYILHLMSHHGLDQY